MRSHKAALPSFRIVTLLWKGSHYKLGQHSFAQLNVDVIKISKTPFVWCGIPHCHGIHVIERKFTFFIFIFWWQIYIMFLHKRVWLGKYIVFTFCESVHIHLWSIQFLRCAFWIWVLCRNSCFFLIKLNWWKIYCLVWSRILAMNIYDTMGNYQSFFTHVKCLLWTRKKFKLVQSFFRNLENISIGIGKTIVEFFSVEMVERVCRYLKKSQESHGPHPIKPNEDANVPIVVI